MTGAFVLDASATIAWASPDEAPADDLVAAIASGGAVAPALWLYEVQNTLVVLKRRGRLTGDDWEAASNAVRAVSIELETPQRERVEEETTRMAEAYGLTVYDAAYLELAKRRRLPLATLDGDLRKAARKAKVALV